MLLGSAGICLGRLGAPFVACQAMMLGWPSCNTVHPSCELGDMHCRPDGVAARYLQFLPQQPCCILQPCMQCHTVLLSRADRGCGRLVECTESRSVSRSCIQVGLSSCATMARLPTHFYQSWAAQVQWFARPRTTALSVGFAANIWCHMTVVWVVVAHL